MNRFMSKVCKSKSGCWEWTGSVRGKYGMYWSGEKSSSAHRESYRIHIGEIPSGKMVLHRCDNYLCVNPDHLWIGTQSDNMRDCLEKGRHPSQRPDTKYCRGKSHPFFRLSRQEREEFYFSQRKLSDAQIKVIMRLHFIYGVPTKELQDLFGVSPATIRRVNAGSSFKRLTAKPNNS